MAPAGSKREFENDFNPYAAPDSKDYANEDEGYEAGPVEYATFLTRFAAVFLDGIIMNILSFAVGVAAGIILVGIGIDPTTAGPQITLTILGFVLGWLYEAGMTSSSYQATLGKMAVGIKVTDLEGRRIGLTRATGRIFARIPSAMILGIGYFMQPFTEKKQALHDMLAGTLVVKSR